MGNAAATQKLTTWQAVLDVKVTRDKLVKQKRKLAGDCARLTGDAKTLLREGKKDRAALLIKVRHGRERDLAQLEGQIANMESLVSDLQRAETQGKVFESLKQGNEALKSLQALMPIDEVQKLMDENAENLAQSDELNDLLAGMSTADEADALVQLEALERELAPPAAKVHLPPAPTHAPQVPVEAGAEPVEAQREAVLS